MSCVPGDVDEREGVTRSGPPTLTGTSFHICQAVDPSRHVTTWDVKFGTLSWLWFVGSNSQHLTFAPFSLQPDAKSHTVFSVPQ